MMISEHLVKAIFAALAACAGVVVGWAGSSLTMAGRVDAIEAAMQRLESMMTTVILNQASRPAPPELVAQPPRKKAP